MLTRRSFSTLLAGAPLAARAERPTGRARVKIDTGRVISEIDNKIYGNFLEHLGRCIEGGVFDEGSPLSDANGFRRDVLDAAGKLNIPILRWPGGNFSSNYHWKDGIGPRDDRPRRLEMAWGSVEDNRFGTHDFLKYAETLGTEPYICANPGTGSWEEAQQWVEYCNSSEDTALTKNLGTAPNADRDVTRCRKSEPAAEHSELAAARGKYRNSRTAIGSTATVLREPPMSTDSELNGKSATGANL
ncbi:MAG: hypothetical protein M3Y07_12815 [Acidobacteriota bacterium]|nr:hypothetical protein [Acidobacteriota bacterium]